MRILLLGEFSALHKNLRDGLRELGHEAVVASVGDGWKRIPADIDLGSQATGWRGRLERIARPEWSLPKLTGYDVVQIINPLLFSRKGGYNSGLLRAILAGNDRAFLVGAGDDAFYWREGRQTLAYGPFDDIIRYDLKGEACPWLDPKVRAFNLWLAQRVEGILPIMYDYWVGYQAFPHRRAPLPIPVNVTGIPYQENTLHGGKLRVFHGLNREGFKGTHYVREAFAFLQQHYPHEVECSIEGGMPLPAYLEHLSKMNVVIDQTSSYSCGVNALFALALGKVVLGGAEPENHLLYGDAPMPVLNITPDAGSIVRQVEAVLAQRADLAQLGAASREFVATHHDHVRVAERYLAAWAQPKKAV